jgi:hypothetical protein
VVRGGDEAVQECATNMCDDEQEERKKVKIDKLTVTIRIRTVRIRTVRMRQWRTGHTYCAYILCSIVLHSMGAA